MSEKLQDFLALGVLSRDNDVTDDRFKLEDKKRRIAQEVFEQTASKRLDAAKVDYAKTKQEVALLVQEDGNDKEKHNLREVLAREQTFINSTNPERVETAIRDLLRIQFPILMRKPNFLVEMFGDLMERRASMNDQLQTKQLFDNGKRLIAAEAWDELRQVNGRLLNLVPDNERDSDDMRLYTGIV
jgi:molecular chaperone DnaK